MYLSDTKLKSSRKQAKINSNFMMRFITESQINDVYSLLLHECLDVNSNRPDNVYLKMAHIADDLYSNLITDLLIISFYVSFLFFFAFDGLSFIIIVCCLKLSFLYYCANSL
ncbi:hypothetical protein AB4K20DRAFT_1878231 [Rhizopus microsporus]